MSWDFQSFDVASNKRAMFQLLDCKVKVYPTHLKPWSLDSVIEASCKQVAKFVLLEGDYGCPLLLNCGWASTELNICFHLGN